MKENHEIIEASEQLEVDALGAGMVDKIKDVYAQRKVGEHLVTFAVVTVLRSSIETPVAEPSELGLSARRNGYCVFRIYTALFAKNPLEIVYTGYDFEKARQAYNSNWNDEFSVGYDTGFTFLRSEPEVPPSLPRFKDVPKQYRPDLRIRR